MQFSLDEYITATLAHVNKRVEAHGGEKRHAMDLKWVIEGPNTILAKFPGLLDGLYEPNDTQDIPGVPAVRPNLRTKGLVKGPFKLEYEGTGYIMTIRHGAVSDAKIELPASELKGFEWDAKKGNGHGKFTFTSQHVGLDEPTMGRLVILDQRQVDLLAAPPAMQDGTVPERLTKSQLKAQAKAAAEAAFSKPLPGVDPNPPDATTAFLDNEKAGLNKPAPPSKSAKSRKPSLKVVGRSKARTGKGS